MTPITGSFSGVIFFPGAVWAEVALKFGNTSLDSRTGQGDNDDTPQGYVTYKPSTSQANNISRGQRGTAKTLENVGKPVSFLGIDDFTMLF